MPAGAAAEFPGWATFLPSARLPLRRSACRRHLTLSNATAAGGADNSPNNVTSNGKSIDHFRDVYGDQLVTAYQSVV